MQKLFLILVAFAAFGFQCVGQTNTFTIRRFSSIPPRNRYIVFSSDCGAVIHEPPNTPNPFSFTMAQSTCDSLEHLCEAYTTFDTLYFEKGFVPNGSSMVLEFNRGGVVKTVHINNEPHLPPALHDLLEFAGRIEWTATDLMYKNVDR